MHQHKSILTFLFSVIIITYSHAGYSNEDVWAKLEQGGYVVLIRHASTENVGNPLAFKSNDCSVQRNLSQKGRKEAKLIGQAFHSRFIPVAKVLSSRYCRTQETAKLAFNQVTPWQPLDLLHALPDQDRDARTQIVAKRVGTFAGSGNLIMVTHRPNIDALTFELVETGGLLVLKPDHEGGYDIVGQLSANDLKRK